MYRCEVCGEVSRPGEPASFVVAEQRPREYPLRPLAEPPVRRLRRAARRHPEKFFEDDPGGRGWEIARQVISCVRCARRNVTDHLAA